MSDRTPRSLTADPVEQQMRVFASLPSAAAPRPRMDAPGVTSYYELTYAQVPGYRPLSLDLHVPEGDGPFPTLLWVHGGGWVTGTRTMGRANKMARYGYAVAATEYRLAAEARFPAQLHDLKGAVRWLRANAAEFRLDAGRIAGWGASAGAHLVALVALTPGIANLEGEVGGHLEQSAALQAVVDFFGVSDLVMLDSGRMTGTPMPGDSATMQHALLGYAPSDHPTEARAASPLGRVGREAPPFFIGHGDVDPLVPFQHSQLLHDALQRAGGDVTLVAVRGAVHEDPQFWEAEVQDMVRAFLDRALPPAVTASGHDPTGGTR